MNRALVVSLVLAFVSASLVAGIVGYSLGQRAERADSKVERKRAVERAELVAERRVSKALDDAETARDDADAASSLAWSQAEDWAQRFAKCLTDSMVEDGFFDGYAVTEEAALAHCSETVGAGD